MYSGFTGAAREQPDEAAALGLLQHLDKQQLQDLLDDEAKLQQIIMDLSQVSLSIKIPDSNLTLEIKACSLPLPYTHYYADKI